MKKQLLNIQIALLALFSVLVLTSVNAQSFDFTITDANMTVQISDEVCPQCENGDLLGAFFTNDAGELQCAGYTLWEGIDQYAIAVMASESGLDNGFAAGEEFTWGIGSLEGGATMLLSSEMNANPPFSTTFIANGFGQILSLSELTDAACADNDDLVSPLGCATAVSALGCDFTYNGTLVSEACPETCDSCPEECADNDDLVSPLGCATAVSALGCDFTYNGTLVSDACPETCDSCGDSAPVLGCTCELAFNYDPNATEDDGSCVVLSGGCGDSDSDYYSGDACSTATFADPDCGPSVIGPFDFTITDANMTITCFRTGVTN